MDLVTITKKEYKTLVRKKNANVSNGESDGFRFSKVSPFIGMWKNRKDVRDSVAYLRRLREKEDKRSR